MAIKSTDETSSRYSAGGTTDEFPTRLGWWERNEYTFEADDIVYIIPLKYSIRPDLLAADVYGRSNIMWIILQYNAILDINTEFVAGKTIRLPNPTRVNFSGI